jgi:hypothetical protein
MLSLFTVIVVFALSGCGNEAYSTSDIADYGVYTSHIENEAEELASSRSHLFVFPKELTDTHEVENFYYSCSSGSFDNAYQLFLAYTLPQDEFEAEVKRLAELEVTYGGVTNKVIYDTTSFNYPAYVTAFSKYGDYEYVLIDEENLRLICILSCVANIDNMPMDKGYLPQDSSDYENLDGRNGYSIYSFTDKDGVITIPSLAEIS